jgi:hypothetical protein
MESTRQRLIIKKALRDAKAIERGELKTRALDDLLAELENEALQEEAIAKNGKKTLNRSLVFENSI